MIYHILLTQDEKGETMGLFGEIKRDAKKSGIGLNVNNIVNSLPTRGKFSSIRKNNSPKPPSKVTRIRHNGQLITIKDDKPKPKSDNYSPQKGNPPSGYGNYNPNIRNKSRTKAPSMWDF